MIIVARVMDFMAVSQVLALLCLFQNGFVQYALQKEAVRANVLKSVAKSAALKLFDQDVGKPTHEKTVR